VISAWLERQIAAALTGSACVALLADRL